MRNVAPPLWVAQSEPEGSRVPRADEEDELEIETLKTIIDEHRFSQTDKLSDRARLLLLSAYRSFRENPGPIPAYTTFVDELGLSLDHIDEAATELAVHGFVQIIKTMGDQGNCGVFIQDKGKVAAAKIRDARTPTRAKSDGGTTSKKTPWILRVSHWILDNIIAKIVVAIVVTLLLLWFGLR